MLIFYVIYGGLSCGFKLLTIQTVWQETAATRSSSSSLSYKRYISGYHPLNLKSIRAEKTSKLSNCISFSK